MWDNKSEAAKLKTRKSGGKTTKAQRTCALRELESSCRLPNRMWPKSLMMLWIALQHRWTECIANFDWLSKNELIKTKWLCKCNCAILSKSEIPLSHIEFLTGTNDTFQIKYRGIHSKFKNRHSLQLNSLTFIPISDESKLVTHCQWVTHVRAHTHTHSGSWLHIILDIDWLWQRTEVIHLPYSFSIDN